MRSEHAHQRNNNLIVASGRIAIWKQHWNCIEGKRKRHYAENKWNSIVQGKSVNDGGTLLMLRPLMVHATQGSFLALL